MIKSMTGFGQAVLNRGDVNISVEVKSLNSKFLDLSLRNDWDSRLPAPHSFLYPSVGVSAIISEIEIRKNAKK